MKLSIAHIFPELLNMYGDRGNLVALSQRCCWRDIEVEITNIGLGDSVDPDKYDFYFIGGGQDQQQIAAAKRLQELAPVLKEAAETNAVFLAICGGFQLLGHYYQPFDDDRINGISLIDAYTVAGKERFIGNVTIELDESIKVETNTLVGFENHSGLTYLGSDLKPLGKIVVGKGNNGQDFTEGVAYNNIFGTYLHGSLLPKNPHFTDYLIFQGLSRKYGDLSLVSLDDTFEMNAHQQAISRKY